jgi:hypothetical protein
VANPDDANPALIMNWAAEKIIKSVTLFLDTDYDHPMESSQMGHPEDVMPFVVRDFTVFNEKDEILYDVKNNHQTIIRLNGGVEKPCNSLIFKFKKTEKQVPISIFQIQINSSN